MSEGTQMRYRKCSHLIDNGTRKQDLDGNETAGFSDYAMVL